MDPNTFPTKGNLILAKNSLSLSKMGYDLMDKKRNILIRELMALIDPDEEKVAAHMADQKRQQRKVTDRLAYIRQSTKRITREAYAEEIDEQRQRMATVTSLEAARAGKAKQQVADKAAGRRKAASAGENAVRSMIAANGEKLLKRSAR